MEIISNKDLLQIISNKAKYQKVLLIYDNTVSSLQINELYTNIKNLCIFNKMEINSIDENEFFNGYKMLIFYCNTTNLIKFKLNREEFINVYIPSNNYLLPIFSNKFCLLTNNCYLLTNSTKPDLTILSSLYFNNFINYTNNILNFKDDNFNFLHLNEINLFNIIKTYNSYLNFYFTDLEIVSNTQIKENEIILLHLIIINAFLIFIIGIKNNQHSVIDVFKVFNGNYEIIDKCYSTFFNDSFYNSINLNFDHLYSACVSTKNKILNLLNLNNTYTNNINTLINKIKNYLKNSNCKLNYLYFFNVFGN